MQDIEKLINRLHNGIVEFEYKKKDGSTRNARGTLYPEFLPKKENEEIKFNVRAIDALLEAKGISFEEYTESNNLDFLKKENEKYVFTFKRKKKEKQENKIIYYDLESSSFRSFIKENLIRIIE